MSCFVEYTSTITGATEIILVTIDVLDVNDEVPRLFGLAQPHIVEVGENLNAPASILRLQAFDNDEGANGTVTLALVSGNASLFDISTGPLTSLRILLELDFERDLPVYNVTIRLTDGGSPSNSFDQEIMVLLLNRRDSSPMIAEESLELSLPEDHPVGASNPFSAPFEISNADDVLGTPTFSLDPASPGNVIAVNANTGELYLSGPLDFDNIINPVRTISFFVRVSNGITGGDSVSVTVTVTDVNDNAPFLECLDSSSSGSIPCPSPASNFTQLTFTVTSDLTGIQNLFLQPRDNDFSAINTDSQIVVSSLNTLGVRFQPVGSASFVLFIDPASVSNGTVLIDVRNTACPLLSSSARVDIVVPSS